MSYRGGAGLFSGEWLLLACAVAGGGEVNSLFARDMSSPGGSEVGRVVIMKVASQRFVAWIGDADGCGVIVESCSCVRTAA